MNLDNHRHGKYIHLELIIVVLQQETGVDVMAGRIIDCLINETIDSAVNDIAIYRHSVYIDSSNVGLASTANANPCDDIDSIGRLHEMKTRELAGLLNSGRIIEAAIGLAAINASLDLNRWKNRLIRKNAVKILRERGAGKNVSIIGNFPFVESFIKDGVCENVWVFELYPKSPDDLSPERMPDFLPRSDVVLISGTTIINHSFKGIIGLCKESYNIVLGPSTPLSPLLFDFGIDAICGAIVVDKKKARLSLAQGARYRDAEGLEFVCLER
jgi:uncharacterized protein (DUF4213/DUF364 family)